MSEDTHSRWRGVLASLKSWEGSLAVQKGARDQIARARDKEVAALATAETEQREAHQGQLFLLSEVAERRQAAIKAIESMGSSALRQVYGPGYRLLFETFDDSRKTAGTNSFRMAVKIGSPHENGELITGLDGERGGGVQEIVAFALRIASLNWLGYDGPLLMDEAYVAAGNDYKIEAVGRFLREVTNQTGRQIIFVTHDVDVFKPIADRVFVVRRDDGIAVVEVAAAGSADREVEEL
jgi:hypothetical protein